MFVQSLGEAWTSWMLYVVYFFLYLVVVLGLERIAYFFFGKDVSIVTIKVVGFPIWIIYLVIEQVCHIVYWPWRFRQRRLLREIFEIETPGWETQGKVDDILKQKAGVLAQLFEDQEKIRKDGGDTSVIDRYIRDAKKDFWQAHRVAIKANYSAPERLRDYPDISKVYNG